MTTTLNSRFDRRRAAYLSRCMKISLIRRWFWLVLAGAMAVLVGSAAGLGTVATLGSGLGGMALVAVLVAVSSWQRHSGDFCVGRSRDLTQLLSADSRARLLAFR